MEFRELARSLYRIKNVLFRHAVCSENGLITVSLLIEAFIFSVTDITRELSKRSRFSTLEAFVLQGSMPRKHILFQAIEEVYDFISIRNYSRFWISFISIDPGISIEADPIIIRRVLDSDISFRSIHHEVVVGTRVGIHEGRRPIIRPLSKPSDRDFHGYSPLPFPDGP